MTLFYTLSLHLLINLSMYLPPTHVPTYLSIYQLIFSFHGETQRWVNQRGDPTEWRGMTSNASEWGLVRTACCLLRGGMVNKGNGEERATYVELWAARRWLICGQWERNTAWWYGEKRDSTMRKMVIMMTMTIVMMIMVLPAKEDERS